MRCIAYKGNYHHPLWSRCVHPLRTYDAFAVNKLCDLMTLPCMAFDVLNFKSPPLHQLLMICHLDLYIFELLQPQYNTIYSCSRCACAVSRDLWKGITMSEITDQRFPTKPQLLTVPMMINDVIYWWSSLLLWFLQTLHYDIVCNIAFLDIT